MNVPSTHLCVETWWMSWRDSHRSFPVLSSFMQVHGHSWIASDVRQHPGVN